MAEDGTPLERILKRDGMPEAFELLSERLSGSDLTSLLLEVSRRRADKVTPAEVMRRYRTDRFVAPATAPFSGLRRAEQACIDVLPPSFEMMTVSPVVPLGTHSALAPVDQNKVVSTVRSTEVAADPTNALALEASLRREQLLASDSRSAERVRLAALQRVVRAQLFEGARSFAHFSIFALVTAGCDAGGLALEMEAAAEHLHIVGKALIGLGASKVSIELTDFAGTFAPVVDALRGALAGDPVEVVDRPDRASGRGYYEGFCFKAFPTIGHETFEVADGGFVDWTQRLVESKKERLLISGIGLDRLALARSD